MTTIATGAPAKPAPSVPQTVSPPAASPRPRRRRQTSLPRRRRPSTSRPHRQPRPYAAPVRRRRRSAIAVHTACDPATAAAAAGRKAGRDRAAGAGTVARVSHEVEEEAGGFAARRLADRRQGHGAHRQVRPRAVRLVHQGSSNEKGEAILINMKPKSDTQWTGSVYSQDSGETYYGTMAMKGVEHASRRSLRARPLLLLRQQLEPHQRPRRQPDDLAADARRAAFIVRGASASIARPLS